MWRYYTPSSIRRQDDFNRVFKAFGYHPSAFFHFKYQALAASERQKRDLEGEEKIEERRWSFLMYPDLRHPSLWVFVSSVIRLWGDVGRKKNIPHIYDSAPDMKNARHFQSCPNLCTSYFQFSVMEGWRDSGRFCHPFFIGIRMAVWKLEILIRVD